MDCPQCHTSNVQGQVYCKSCGIQMDLSFDAVHQSVTDQLEVERETRTEQQLQELLVSLITLLLVLLVLRSIAGEVPDQYAGAGYISPRAQVDVERVPLQIPWDRFDPIPTQSKEDNGR